jgi:hypothetical protein
MGADTSESVAVPCGYNPAWRLLLLAQSEGHKSNPHCNPQLLKLYSIGRGSVADVFPDR